MKLQSITVALAAYLVSIVCADKDKKKEHITKWVGIRPNQEENNSPFWGLAGTYTTYLDRTGLHMLRVTSTITKPTKLRNNHVYQSWFQIQDDEETRIAGKPVYESFTCTIKYDFRRAGYVRQDHIWKQSSCGTSRFSLIGDVTFSQVRDKMSWEDCNPWFWDSKRSTTDNSVPGRESVTCSVYRKMAPWKSGIGVKFGDALTWRTGYNAWKGQTDENRIAFGFSGDMTMKI